MNATLKKNDENLGPELSIKNGTMCLVQISRIGDVLQTYQAAKIFKNSHPEIRLILVARKKFAHGLDFLLRKVFSQIYYFNYDEHRKENPAETRLSLLAFTSMLSAESIDITVNFTYSKSSSYLCTLIDCKHRIGPHFNSKNIQVINDKWSQLVYSTVMRGPYNPFNLVDIFRNALGFSPNIRPVADLSNREKKVIIHPFASHIKKQWRPTKWVEVIYRVLKDNPEYRITLVGAPNEREQADEIMKTQVLKDFLNRIDNQVGTTTLEALYQNLSTAQLFVGHDSMTGHLASVADTQTLTISLGTVRPQETSPYGSDNYTVAPTTKCFPCFPNDKCSLHQCHADIPHQLVSSAISTLIAKGFLASEDIQKNNSIFHLSSVNIYRSYFTTQGYFDLVNITHQSENASEIFRLFYRIAILYYFSEKEETHDFPIISQASKSTLTHYLSGIEHLYQLADFGMKYCRYIIEEIASKSPDLAKIRAHSAKIDEIDRMQEQLLIPYPMLRPIVDFFTLAKANTPGEHLVEISENSFLLYNDYSIVTRIIYDLIKSSVPDIEVAKQSAKADNVRGNV